MLSNERSNFLQKWEHAEWCRSLPMRTSCNRHRISQRLFIVYVFIFSPSGWSECGYMNTQQVNIMPHSRGFIQTCEVKLQRKIIQLSLFSLVERETAQKAVRSTDQRAHCARVVVLCGSLCGRRSDGMGKNCLTMVSTLNEHCWTSEGRWLWRWSNEWE